MSARGVSRQFEIAAIAVIVMIAMLAGVQPAQAQFVARFTADQADAGKQAFATNCTSCHGVNLQGGVFGPALKGDVFKQRYFGKTADALFTVMSTKMPPDRPGALDTATYAAILAYVLQQNDIKPGSEALPADPAAIASLLLPSTGLRAIPAGFVVAGLSPYAPLPPAVKLPNPLDNITPVTDAMLIDPPPSDWLTWRRTYDDHGFSPLKQIDKGNVHELGVAWSWTLPSGGNEIAPLVHNGVLFLEASDKVEALNAKTGDLLWVYARRLPQGVRAGQKKALAIYGDRLFVGTSDIHMVALDVKTGKVIWDTPVGDYKLQAEITGGPLVAKGKVMIGIVGMGTTAILPGGPEIVALDTDSGKILWQFHTIAKPGEPGGNSWGNIPYEKRTGGSVWTPGSYDPKLGLAYFGTGNTYDTGPLLHPPAGDTGDALYTDSTLALDPDTGKLAWYFQHVPNDQWDHDWAFERILASLPVHGVTRTLAITAGKEALYDALDAETGKYAFSIDTGLQNVISAIDPETGAKTINPAMIPGKKAVITVCPSAAGAKSWMPASYNAATHVLFVSLVEACMDLYPMQGAGLPALTSGYNIGLRLRPDSDGKYGRLEAINLATRKVVWSDRQRPPMTSGVLTTAGGVAFAASMDRTLRAYDQANGKVLWQFRLNDMVSQAPITYSVDGKQYIAVLVAPGTYQSFFYAPLVPEYPAPPDRGDQLWVFALP